jgi:hypothetical protein
VGDQTLSSQAMTSQAVRIGYSFWGFLGPGVIDTPDGGRSHRRGLIDGLRSRGHRVVFLQADRDRLEADQALTEFTWDSEGLPEIDLLFLEWRWAIPGRNTTPCTRPRHTCDLHRQNQLLQHYTHRLRTPTIIWDKDRKLPAGNPLRRSPVITICEAALLPTPGAVSLLFPVADALLDRADPTQLAAAARDLDLAYVGNQYERDDAFATYLAPATARMRHVVAGKWPDTAAWPHVNFTGRIPFPQVAGMYRRSLATVLLVPDRYAAAGQMTQRIFEAVLAGCLPLTPATIRGADCLTPTDLHVRNAQEVQAVVRRLRRIAGTREHENLIVRSLQHLDLFRLSRQLDTLDQILRTAVRAPAQAEVPT